MSNRKTFWIVLISIVAVLVLAAGGYALYRWGFARGVAVEMPELIRSPMLLQRGGEEVFEFGEYMMPWGHHSGMRVTGMYGYSMPHYMWWGGGFFALLLGGGVLALAVYGLIALLRRDGTSAEVVASKKK